MTKQELIDQYQQRIKSCDNMLDVFKKNIRTARHNKTSSEADRLEKRHFDAQRQCYVQFVSDLEYELDEKKCPLYTDPHKSCKALKDRELEIAS